ncbi:uncharacterized protein C8R40DRAFT_1168377 [Lentinula edodes]|uniref:uncharacterized protein n=1 Tax=Lentinula edodes TaxID=5353 RepID=UPI001E8D3DFB|nr:uncharacterized protein C8R40DRAFT_1168377 [Lentinula edodes]KAH7877660.1 hypothetical protein C8R40DRAFT_1168377 [Lentinula edodes]
MDDQHSAAEIPLPSSPPHTPAQNGHGNPSISVAHKPDADASHRSGPSLQSDLKPQKIEDSLEHEPSAAENVQGNTDVADEVLVRAPIPQIHAPILSMQEQELSVLNSTTPMTEEQMDGNAGAVDEAVIAVSDSRIPAPNSDIQERELPVPEPESSLELTPTLKSAEPSSSIVREIPPVPSPPVFNSNNFKESYHPKTPGCPLSGNNSVSSVLISSALETIASSKDAKRSAPLKESTQKVLDLIRSNQGGADYNSPPNSPGPSLEDNLPSLVDLVAHTTIACHTENTPDAVSLQIVKALLSLVLSPTILVHHSSLLKAVRTVYNVFLLSTDVVPQMVAQGGLTQMVHHVFTRCRIRDYPPSIDSATLSRSPSQTSFASPKHLPFTIPSPITSIAINGHNTHDLIHQAQCFCFDSATATGDREPATCYH